MRTLLPILCFAVALTACGGGSSSGSSGGKPPVNADGLSAAAQLGEKIFDDAALSASGTQSCGSCHVEAFAFTADRSAAGPDHGSTVPLGGTTMDLPGFRDAPSLVYASYSPAFFFDSEGGPNGGFFRDGRADTLADQAIEPFTTRFEMANADAAAVIAKLRTRPYLAEYEALYGAAVLDDPDTALKRIGAAIAAYETEASEFHPFSSKYDAFQNGQATLTAQELRGLGLFNDPSKGNCAGCHPSTSADGGTPPLFTDFSYDNLGVPRNTHILANDPGTAWDYTPANGTDGLHFYYDLGICGPFRDNGSHSKSGLCGAFKVPTLRNVAVTGPYFHNGRFATLKDAIGFYVRRDTNPEEFYPTTVDGTVTKFDDLPGEFGGQFIVNIHVPGSDANYLGNVNTGEIPYNRHIGESPALNADEINDVIVFLCTLTDGFDAKNPTAQVLPVQCQAALSP